MADYPTDRADRPGLSAADTIAALATPPGRGGIAVVRVSGPAVPDIARALLGRVPPPRRAAYGPFRDAAGTVLDRGLALYFPAPRSYTGEHVLELHAHGGPVLCDLLLGAVFAAGARPAQAGEFTYRAYLNGKLDLAQAEAVADVIAAGSAAAVRAATRSLDGEWSAQVQAAAAALLALRAELEAGLDFADEDLDLVDSTAVRRSLDELAARLDALRARAGQGVVLQEGVRVVLAGAPNVGKSSLLNALAGRESAIVTPVPGTTRDVLRETVVVQGLTLHLTDTAGLRASADAIEREGQRRARAELASAGHVLYVTVAAAPDAVPEGLAPAGVPVTRVLNKIDLAGLAPRLEEGDATRADVWLSARTGAGLDLLAGRLTRCAGLVDPGESLYGARRRHLVALDAAIAALAQARAAALPEVTAEGLRAAARALAEITGPEHPETLLGEIFARFCIGK